MKNNFSRQDSLIKALKGFAGKAVVILYVSDAVLLNIN